MKNQKSIKPEEANLAVGLVFVVLIMVGASRYTDASWFLLLGLDSAHITTMYRPTSCDYSTAPLGKKGCRYVKQTIFLDANGNMVGGDEIQPNGERQFTSPKAHFTDALVSYVKINDEDAFNFDQLKKEHAQSSWQTDEHAQPSRQTGEQNPNPLDHGKSACQTGAMGPQCNTEAVKACVLRLKPDPLDADHVQRACQEDPTLGLG